MCLQGLEGEKGLYTRPLSGQCRQQAGDGCGAGEAPVSPPGHEGHSKDQVPITSSCRPHPGGLGEPVGGWLVQTSLGTLGQPRAVAAVTGPLQTLPGPDSGQSFQIWGSRWPESQPLQVATTLPSEGAQGSCRTC